MYRSNLGQAKPFVPRIKTIHERKEKDHMHLDTYSSNYELDHEAKCESVLLFFLRPYWIKPVKVTSGMRFGLDHQLSYNLQFLTRHGFSLRSLGITIKEAVFISIRRDRGCLPSIITTNEMKNWRKYSFHRKNMGQKYSFHEF
jgi:hypothetical protein